MSYLSHKDIQNRVYGHLEFALQTYPEMDWFVCAAQGSMNYNLVDDESDVDTKLLTLPSFQEIVLNRNPVNKTLILENEEHCDCKDTRLYFQTFRKQNINFVEILFTDYYEVNPRYLDLWLTLLANREELVRMNEYAALSCILGMSKEKRHALSHKYPSKVGVIEKFGYDPKQLMHLWRLNMFAKDYLEHYDYNACLNGAAERGLRGEMIACKRNGLGLSLEEAEEWADSLLADTEQRVNARRGMLENKEDAGMSKLLDDTLLELMRRSLKFELENK